MKTNELYKKVPFDFKSSPGIHYLGQLRLFIELKSIL